MGTTVSLIYYIITERDLTSEEECRGEYSTGCDSDGEECQYKATWRVTSDHVIFDVTARIEEGQWVAIGFSDDRMMVRKLNYNILKPFEKNFNLILVISGCFPNGLS